MNTAQYIKDWIARASRSGMEREDVIFLMVQVRHLIEGKHNIADYRSTELYCNWMVHTNLYTSDGGLLIIKDLTNTLVENWSKTKETLGEEISNIFGLSKLRKELIALFNEYKLSDIILKEDENWKNIVGFLTYYLKGKPINFPDKKTIQKERLQTLIKEIENIEKPADFYIKNVSIIGEKGAFWCIELGGEKNTTKIVGQLVLSKE